MRIVTCHRCWAWVPAQNEQCPECQHALQLDEPDPPAEALAAQIGDIVCRLGAARWERRVLPQTGLLWGTTAGLLFLPELLPLADGSLADASGVDASSNWNWFGLWRRTSHRSPVEDDFPAADVTDAALEFLNRPGAAFFAREDIARLWNRGRTWTLQRTVGRTVKWTMLSPPEQWRPAWRQLFHSDSEWRCVASP